MLLLLIIVIIIFIMVIITVNSIILYTNIINAGDNDSSDYIFFDIISFNTIAVIIRLVLSMLLPFLFSLSWYLLLHDNLFPCNTKVAEDVIPFAFSLSFAENSC